MSNSTMTNTSLGWGGRPTADAKACAHLVIVWSRDEPHRIGEAIPIEGISVIGRGLAENVASLPRAPIVRQRPGSTTPRPPLASLRISRVQLRVTPVTNDRLTVDSLGRCPMLVNGQPAASATVGVGDVVTLRYAMVFLVVLRPLVLEPLRGFSDTSFPFATGDRLGLTGESPPVWALRDNLAIAARSSSHVLIHGPSGVGKELAARAIHDLSERKGPFVARNAATFPEGLIDAELFGTAKGYPNAGTPERPGLLGEAKDGTLFLDEIGELPAHLQAHLLRVLDGDGEYQRLGDTRMLRANVRLVAATNRPVQALKHDFAARFIVRVEIPGLDVRAEDIPLLLRHSFFILASGRPEVMARYLTTGANGDRSLRVDPDLIEALLRHEFTLHVRELLRALECAITTSPGKFLAMTPAVEAALRQPPEQPVESPAAASGALDPADGALALTKAQIEAAIHEAGSITNAARRLGLKNRFALYRLMKLYDIS